MTLIEKIQEDLNFVKEFWKIQMIKTEEKEYKLSRETIITLNSNRMVSSHPLVQLLSVRPGFRSGEQIYKVIVSDGEYYLYGYIPASSTTNEPDNYSIIKLDDHLIEQEDNKIILKILGYTLEGVEKKMIGNPLFIKDLTLSKREEQEKLKIEKEKKEMEEKARVPSLYKIRDLTTDLDMWIIRAQIIEKSNVMTMGKGKKLFHIQLTDESGSIRATVFDDTVDVWQGILQEGKIYNITNGRVRFNKNSNSLELSITENTKIELSNDQKMLDINEVKSKESDRSSDGSYHEDDKPQSDEQISTDNNINNKDFNNISDENKNSNENDNEVPEPEGDNSIIDLTNRPKRNPKIKRNRNAFLFFAQEERSNIKNQNPEMSYSQILKKLGEIWRDMDDDLKEIYYEMARKDKERYNSEMMNSN